MSFFVGRFWARPVDVSLSLQTNIQSIHVHHHRLFLLYITFMTLHLYL